MPFSRRSTAALALPIAAAALLVAGCSGSTEVSTDPVAHGISTTGAGIVTGTPDTVTVTLAVQTQAPTANAALAENAQRATSLIETIKSKGVDAKDIQTSGLSVYPNYEPTTAQISGYMVTNQVTATLHDVSKAGALIDAAASAAGDAIRVQQMSFSIADDSDLRAQARASAVQQAQSQAQQIAEAAGVKLGDIRSIVETPASTNVVDPQMRSMADSLASTPVQAGSQELSVSVSVVYEID